jgi:hypothetical protein
MLQALRNAANHARKLANEHRREHRHSDPDDPAIKQRGEDLEAAAVKAAQALSAAETKARADAVVQRREDRIAGEADLQSRLRADTLARNAKRKQDGA